MKYSYVDNVYHVYFRWKGWFSRNVPDRGVLEPYVEIQLLTSFNMRNFTDFIYPVYLDLYISWRYAFYSH